MRRCDSGLTCCAQCGELIHTRHAAEKDRFGQALRAPAEAIAAQVRTSEVIASDETNARVKGKTWWQWTFGCATAASFVIAETRGKCVPTAFLAGVKPKMWLSDRLPAQLRHAEQHQFCLAHLIRDAQYAIWLPRSKPVCLPWSKPEG